MPNRLAKHAPVCVWVGHGAEVRYVIPRLFSRLSLPCSASQPPRTKKLGCPLPRYHWVSTLNTAYRGQNLLETGAKLNCSPLHPWCPGLCLRAQKLE